MGRGVDRLKAFFGRRRNLYVASLLLQLAIAPFFVHDWDGFVFLKSVEQFLGGQTPYAVAEAAPNFIFLNEQWPSPNSWFAYPPLALLIMTPVLALAYGAGVTAPWALRLALKVPMVLGNLALAYVIGEAVRELGGDERARRRAESFILFNPFLIFVAAVWGMFDAWMMALLIGSAVLLARNRHAAAGVVFGLAALVKIFPLFVSPVFFIWAVRNARTSRDVGVFVGSAVATFGLVSLPFLLDAPAGFVQQTLTMHVERPLQGFTTLGLLYAGNFTEARFGFRAWPAPPEWVGPMLSSVLLIPVLLLAFAFTTSGRADARNLLRATTVTLVLVLMVSKVVNEQYFVMPIALFAVLAFTPGASHRTRWALRAWTAGGLVAGLLLGFHWLTFVPHDVAPWLLGMQPSEAIYGLGVFADQRLGIHPNVFYVIPDVVSAAAVAPAFLISAWLVLVPLREAVVHIGEHRRSVVPGFRRSLALATSVIIVVAPLALAAATTYAKSHDVEPAMPTLGERVVGATYYVWWNNPSHDPDVADGNWGRTSLTPANGYFTSNGHQIELDVAAMREAGLDFAAVSYHGYDHNRYEVVLRVARAYGLYVAPLVEAGEVLGKPGHATVADDPTVPITMRPTDATADEVAELVRHALELRGSEAFLRFEGKPVVFVNDGHLVGPSWDPESKRLLAEGVVKRHNGSHDDLSRAWGRDLSTIEAVVAEFPKDLVEWQAADPESADWRWALDDRRDQLWERVRAAAGEDVYLVGTEVPYFDEMAGEFPFWARKPLDASFRYGALPAYLRAPLNYSREDNLTAWSHDLAVQAVKYRGEAFATVHYAFDDRALRPATVEAVLAPDDPVLGGDALARGFELAERYGHRRVLVASWNNHFDGTSVAPSVQHGRAPLDALAREIAEFKSRSDARPRVLVLVNEWGGLSDVWQDKKDWTFSLALQLPWRLQQAMRGADVEVVEMNERLPEHVLQDSLRYDAIWVEAGSGRFRAPREVQEETFATLMYYVHHGGDLVLLGGGLPKPYEDVYLAEGFGNVHAPAVAVTWDGGRATFPDTDRYPMVRPAAGCETLATFEATATPAAWACPLGEGRLVATAFRPQSWDYRIDPGSNEVLERLAQVTLAP